jgi:ATP-dependent DNA helicase RecG
MSDNIAELVDRGETLTIEFKSHRSLPSDSDLVEAVICLANSEGGHLLLGVEDDGTVTGLSSSVDSVRIQALIMNKTMPPLSCSVTIECVQGSQVAVISVPKAASPVGTTSGTYKRRALKMDGSPECVPYSLNEMLSQAVSLGQQDYGRLSVAGLTWEDLDPDQFDVFRRMSGAGGDVSLSILSNLEIARALSVVSVGGNHPEPLMGALLLFGRTEAIRRFAPTHEVLFQVSENTDLKVSDDVTAGLLSATEVVFQRFLVWNTHTEVSAGLVHMMIPLVPEGAFREAIANALVHRDYALLGPTRVFIDDSGVTISNPGGFVEGVRLDNLLDQSKPRSPVLANAFRAAGIVERSGLGIRRMFESILRAGRIAPDYSRTTSTQVTLRFQTTALDVPLIRFFVEEEQRLGRLLPLADMLVLQHLKHAGRIRLKEAESLAQLPETQTREVLTRLVENGFLEVRGTGQNRSYHLSSSAFRRLGEPSAYVRIKGFDDIRLPSMILDYVKAHGTITRSQASELCSIIPTHASVLLRSLVDSGKLALRGSRRGSHYVLP